MVTGRGGQGGGGRVVLAGPQAATLTIAPIRSLHSQPARSLARGQGFRRRCVVRSTRAVEGRTISGLVCKPLESTKACPFLLAPNRSFLSLLLQQKATRRLMQHEAATAVATFIPTEGRAVYSPLQENGMNVASSLAARSLFDKNGKFQWY